MSANEAAERLYEFLAEISNDQPSDALRDLADALAHERSYVHVTTDAQTEGLLAACRAWHIYSRGDLSVRLRRSFEEGREAHGAGAAPPDVGALKAAGFEPDCNVCAACKHRGSRHDLNNRCRECDCDLFSGMSEGEKWSWGIAEYARLSEAEK